MDPDPLAGGGVWAVWSPPLPAPAAALPPAPPPPPPPQAAKSMATATLTISLFVLFTLMSGTMTSCNNCPVLCKRTGSPRLVGDLRRHSLKTERNGNCARSTSTKVDERLLLCESQHRPGHAIVRWITNRNQHRAARRGWKIADVCARPLEPCGGYPRDRYRDRARSESRRYISPALLLSLLMVRVEDVVRSVRYEGRSADICR